MTYTVHRLLDLHHRPGAEASRECETAADAVELLAGAWRSEWTHVTAPDGTPITTAELYVRSVDEREAQRR